MTTYRADLKTDIQYMLKDASTVKFLDEDIESALDDGIVELSMSSPYRKRETLTFASATRDLDISTLIDTVLYVSEVEYPIGEYPKHYVNFTQWGATLSLKVDRSPASGATAYLYCEEVHTLSETVNTMTKEERRLLANLTAGHLAFAKARSHIDASNTGGENTPYVLLRWAEDKLSDTRRQLRRLKRPQQRNDYSE